MEDKADNLIEEMTINNYQWSNEGGKPKRATGELEVDAYFTFY